MVGERSTSARGGAARRKRGWKRKDQRTVGKGLAPTPGTCDFIDFLMLIFPFLSSYLDLRMMNILPHLRLRLEKMLKIREKWRDDTDLFVYRFSH